MPSRSLTTSDLSKLVQSDPVGTMRVRTRVSSSHSEGDFTSLPPEPQQGNVEYKLKLVNPTNQRMEHLVTQVGLKIVIASHVPPKNTLVKNLTQTTKDSFLKNCSHRLFWLLRNNFGKLEEPLSPCISLRACFRC